MLAAILKAARKNWIICAAASVLLATGAFVLGMVMPPVYRVEAVLSPVVEDPTGGALDSLGGAIGGLTALAGLTTHRGQAKFESIAILRSWAFIGRFIREKNLIPVLFDVGDEDGQSPGRNGGRRRSDITLNDAIALFREQVLTVKDDPKTGMVTLRVEWGDPEVAANWCAELVARVNETIRTRDIREAQHSIEYLEKQLGRTNQVGIQQAISRVLEHHVKIMTLASVRPEYAFKIVDPGFVPDADRPVRPRKVRMTLAGFLLGGMLGVLVACIREGIFASDAERARQFIG